MKNRIVGLSVKLLLFSWIVLLMPFAALGQRDYSTPVMIEKNVQSIEKAIPSDLYDRTPLAFSKTTVDSMLLEYFEDSLDMVWIKRFRGSMDDVHFIEINVGFDGLKVRGYVVYKSSGERFRLDGSLTGSILRLEERDSNEQLCGFWTGNIQSNRLRGEWMNVSQTLAGKFDLTETNALPTDNKWLNRYVARWNHTWVEVMLLRAYNGALYGSIYNEGDQETLPLKGEIDESGNYILESPIVDGQYEVELSGQMRYLQASNSTWHHSNGESRHFLMSLKDQVLLRQYEWMDYTTGIDILYPNTKCEACNTMLDTFIRAQLGRLQNILSQNSQPKTPKNRSIHQFNGWTDITYWSDDYLGGFILFADNFRQQYGEGTSFLFDLQNGHPISLSDFFVKNFDYKAWFAEYVHKNAPSMQGYAQNSVYRNWLHQRGFPLIALSREGFCLSTGFHPVFGEQRLQVSFKDIQPFLKKDHPILK